MMFLASTAEINVAGAGVAALLGYTMVFVGLIALMFVVMLMGKIFVSLENKKKAAEPVMEAPVVPVAPPAPTAPGAAGGVKLYDVEPKTAAMLMDIVANKMGKPLNELRFISIKEVK